MGYQVGRICYDKQYEAANVVMTQVVPTIDKDGVLHHPVFTGQRWMYNNQAVQLSFPKCEFGSYAKLGKTLGAGTAGAFIALLIIVIAVKTISLARDKEDEK